MKSMLGVLALLVACSAYAEDDGPTPCDNVDSANSTAECAAYNRKTADEQMNEALTDLLSRIKTQYASDTKSADALTAKIEAAQQGWAKQRDADCEIQAFGADKASYPIVHDNCMADMSDSRSEFLQSLGSD